jgi:hypothetical protein
VGRQPDARRTIVKAETTLANARARAMSLERGDHGDVGGSERLVDFGRIVHLGPSIASGRGTGGR